MSKFTPTSKANPCISCGDTKGNCRHQDLNEIILCMTANSSCKGEIVDGGYKPTFRTSFCSTNTGTKRLNKIYIKTLKALSN